MAFKLNSVVRVWRTASLGHRNRNLNRGRHLGYLLLGNSGGGVEQLISSSSTHSPSSCSLLSQGITINSFSFSSFCNSCLANFVSEEEDHIKPHNPPLLSSMAPCLLIPYPKEDDDHKSEVISAIVKDLGKGTGEEEFHFPDYCFYSLADRKVASLNNVRTKSNIVIPYHSICIGSCHGWLAYVDPDDRVVYLTNPLVSPVPPTIHLPPLQTIPRSICRPFDRWVSPYIQKLVMSSTPSLDNNNDCTIMVIVDNGRLAYCKLGDSSWTALKEKDDGLINSSTSAPSELAYSSKDQLFYCTNFRESELKAWNLRNPCSPRSIDIKSEFIYGRPDFPVSEAKLRDITYGYRRHYLLMESHSGDVLRVTRLAAPFADDGTIIDDDHTYYSDRLRTLRFEVSRLNANKRCWDYVTDLGDGVLFVGLNQVFQVSARDFRPGVLIPNSVYFTFDREEIFKDTGIYNMQDFTVKPLFPSHLHPISKIHQPVPPIWFTPNPWNN